MNQANEDVVILMQHVPVIVEALGVINSKTLLSPALTAAEKTERLREIHLALVALEAEVKRVKNGGLRL